ncbi:phage tail tape measure protein [Candidatus Pacearchaeota archaeon]|nr:phage tail tape measure protein [Candidatus Pacearchaeota archaeon]
MADKEKLIIQIDGDTKEYQKSLKDVEGQTKKTSKALKVAGGVALAAFAAISAVTIKAAKDFIRFENEILSVKTLLDETSFGAKGLEKGFKELKDGALDLAKVSTSSISELNKALFDTVSAGIDASKAVDVLTSANKLAVAGVTNISTATDGLTSAINAYGFSAEQADQVAAKFFTAQKRGKTTVEELSNSFGLVGASANAAGISFEEVLGSIAAVTTAGIKTNAAFTGLKAVIANIAKPSADAAAEAKKLGVQFDAAALRTLGLKGFLEQLTKANGFTKDSVTELFGSVEAQNIIFSLAGTQAKDFARNVKELSDEQKIATTFSDAYNTQNQSLESSMKRLSNTVDVLSIKLGEKLAPAIQAVVDASNQLLTGLFGSEQDKKLLTANNRIEDLEERLGELNDKMKETLAGNRGFFSKLFDPTSVEAFKLGIKGVTEQLKEAKAERDALLKGDADTEDNGEKAKAKEAKDLADQKAIEDKERREQELIDKQEHDNALFEQEVENIENQKVLSEARLASFQDEKDKAAQKEEIDNIRKLQRQGKQDEALVKLQKLKDKNLIKASQEKIKEDKKQDEDKKKEKKKLDSDKKKSRAASLQATQNFLAVGADLARDGSKTQKAIMTTSAIISTFTAATQSLAQAPFPANIALAASITAIGLANIAKINGAKFAKGGMFTGGIPGVDSIPAVVQAGEVVVPTKNFEEVIGSTRAARAANQEGAGFGTPQEIMIGFQSEEAADILTLQDNENTALGINRAIA